MSSNSDAFGQRLDSESAASSAADPAEDLIDRVMDIELPRFADALEHLA